VLRERDSDVFQYVCVRERGECVSACLRVRKRGRVCKRERYYVCVCVFETERERLCACVFDSERESVCVFVYLCICVFVRE